MIKKNEKLASIKANPSLATAGMLFGYFIRNWNDNSGKTYPENFVVLGSFIWKFILLQNLVTNLVCSIDSFNHLRKVGSLEEASLTWNHSSTLSKNTITKRGHKKFPKT